MKEYPMTFDEFNRHFSTEEQCRDYLYQLRFPNGFECPKCKNNKAWFKGITLYECSTCGHQTSVIAGTIFQDTHKPLKTWFTAIWWVTTQKNGASAQGLQQILGLKGYDTAWTWLHKIRRAMVCADRRKLSGTVEVDETYIGGEDTGGKAGRGAGKKTLVQVAVELDAKKVGRIRMSIVKDASSDSLIPFILNNVERGNILVTDAWTGYSGIEEEGYIQIAHNQSKAIHEDEKLPHVHLVMSLLKRWLVGTHQGAVRPKHLQSYLDEFVFRFNRRKSSKRGLLFYRLLENAVKTPPTTLDDLLECPKP
jgi:transposase-like protein/Zn ribbon nucleic-acid-binding protein